MKKTKQTLFERPKGTTMYLLYTDRNGYNLDIKEVEYLGYNRSESEETWPADYRCNSITYTQKLILLLFRDKDTKKEITVTLEENGWSGMRGFNTDEHLTCGRAPYPYMDIYVTVNKDKLIKYLENEGILKLFKKHVEFVNTMWDKIEKYLSSRD